MSWHQRGTERYLESTRFYGPFPIAYYSSLFITLALHIWGPTMANGYVLFFTDNAALVDIINKRTSKTLTGHDSFYVTLYSAAKYWGGGGYIICFRASRVPDLKKSLASPVYRWRDSRNSRRRRTTFQQQCQRTYSLKVGHSLERLAIRLGLFGYCLSQPVP